MKRIGQQSTGNVPCRNRPQTECQYPDENPTNLPYGFNISEALLSRAKRHLRLLMPRGGLPYAPAPRPRYTCRLHRRAPRDLPAPRQHPGARG